MRDFRQKEKKEEKKQVASNKPSRDESSLPRCNISSMAGSAAHGCFVNRHSLRRKNNNNKNTYNITTAKKYALHCWWTVLKLPCSLDRLIQPWTRNYTGAGRARHGSVCLGANSFLLFGESPSLLRIQASLITALVAFEGVLRREAKGWAVCSVPLAPITYLTSHPTPQIPFDVHKYTWLIINKVTYTAAFPW